MTSRGGDGADAEEQGDHVALVHAQGTGTPDAHLGEHARAVRDCARPGADSAAVRPLQLAQLRRQEIELQTKGGGGNRGGATPPAEQPPPTVPASPPNGAVELLPPDIAAVSSTSAAADAHGSPHVTLDIDDDD